MRLLISSTFRHTRWDETSGHVYVFDVDSERVISKSTLKEPEYRKYDPNPRGGFRGVRGLSVNENEIAISNATSIFSSIDNGTFILNLQTQFVLGFMTFKELAHQHG